ncbi:MAG: PilW family protein [Solirubrobacterales bacterium]
MDGLTRIHGFARRIGERLKQEDGFTLSELLSAQIIGGFVIAAAISMVMIAFNSSARTTDRINSAQQGRIAMEEIQQRLRSQTCLYQSEYLLNGATQASGGTIAFLHASPTRMVFFSDLGNTGGSTAATGSVGFSPIIRYLTFDTGATTGTGAYRLGKFVEGAVPPSTSAIPFKFALGVSAVTGLAPVTGMNTLVPTTQRAFAEGVTNDVSGAATLPIFNYYDSLGAAVPTAADGSIAWTGLDQIDSVGVRFRILGQSGKDSATAPSGSTASIDDRTASFNDQIYLRTSQNACA